MSGSKSLAERLAPHKERAESFLREFEWTWTNAVVFSMAVLFFILITMAVIPSFWLYFADQKLMWDGGVDHPLFPWSWAQKVLPWVIPGFWLKELRDAVAMGLSTGPLVTILVAAAILQNWRRRLRGAQSEARPTGGYR
jgi:hypothetical protein